MITSQQIEDAIKCVEIHHFRGTTMTACVLTLQNGFAVLGQSSAIEPAEFDAALGAEYAREDANAKVAELLAFVQREIKGGLNEH